MLACTFIMRVVTIVTRQVKMKIKINHSETICQSHCKIYIRFILLKVTNRM